ncbi:MAG: hypothetical protein H6704_14565 [Myxococcales bacterium]|nr:hypothetical protein [Myxococcales bacterium]
MNLTLMLLLTACGGLEPTPATPPPAPAPDAGVADAAAPDAAPPDAAPPEPDAAPPPEGPAYAAGPVSTTGGLAIVDNTVRRKVRETMEVSVRRWGVEEALDDAAARTACRTKALEVCAAAEGITACRFAVAWGDAPAWDAAETAQKPPEKKKGKKRKGKAKKKRRGKKK